MLRVDEMVIDPEGQTGKLVDLYTHEGAEMGRVEYTEPQFTGDYVLDWALEDLAETDPRLNAWVARHRDQLERLRLKWASAGQQTTDVFDLAVHMLGDALEIEEEDEE